MSARVNLLPREAEEREARRRSIGIVAGIGVVVVAILVGLYFLQVSRVDDAEEELAEAEAVRAELQAEVEGLQQYADLRTRRDAAIEVVTTTMASEISMAGLLQDIAAVMPNEAALTTLSVAVTLPPTPPAGFDFGGPSLGRLTVGGETLEGHAPGVERFLIEFDKVAAFFNVFVSSSTVDEEGIAVFNVESELGPEILTGRYTDGLPEELR